MTLTKKILHDVYSHTRHDRSVLAQNFKNIEMMHYRTVQLIIGLSELFGN